MKQVREYMERTKEVVPTRGTVHDLGRAITHKKIIIRLYLEGYLTPEIARKTKHSEEACDRYIRAFNKVRMLADRNMSVEEIARTLEMSSFTVKEYLNIYSEFKGGVMVMQSNLCVHTKYENMDKIYLYPIWEFFQLAEDPKLVPCCCSYQRAKDAYPQKPRYKDG